MRLKQFRQPFAALASLCLLSCGGSGPEVDVCLSFPEKLGFICVDRDQQPYFLPYTHSLKYVAFSPADAQKLVESCGLSARTKTALAAHFVAVETVAMQAVE